MFAGSPVEALRFDGGSLSLNLVATVGRRYGERVERIGSIERFRAWLRGVGLDVGREPTAAELEQVHTLREHLHQLFRATLDGQAPPQVALDHVNRAAGAAQPTIAHSRGRLVLASARSLDPVLALIALDAIRLLAGDEAARLRSCEADDCRMLYLAHGRRERRWCSSERCGNRSRVAAHRARAARARA